MKKQRLHYAEKKFLAKKYRELRIFRKDNYKSPCKLK